MVNRFRDWQEDLSLDLQKSKKRRRIYFEALREEYENDLEVLRVISRVIGLKEFSKLCGLSPSTVSNYLKRGKDHKVSTLKKLISPFDITTVNISLDEVA